QRPYVIMKWAQTANGFIDNHYRALAISTPFTQMLSHKLRAECDAILVGKTTDEREHPALNTRHWWGKSPRRLVLHRQQAIAQLLAQLYQDNVQTLIVEGGATVHQAFINANCCDEIHRETAPFTVFDGTKAIDIPPKFRLIKQMIFDGNVMEEFVR
ncbi:dihydrofolate reductase family protein, partial [Hoylesella loescheii]|uniref:RibD family protein n=1 Tax=Hoylesella loescheii TaxID=840 RepID=UPI0028E9624D